MVWPRTHAEDLAGSFTRLEEGRHRDQSRDRWGHDVNVRGGKNSRRATGEDDVSLENLNTTDTGIRVKNEVTVSSEAWDHKDRVY